MAERSAFFLTVTVAAFLAACQGGGPAPLIVNRPPTAGGIGEGMAGAVTVGRGDTLYSISRRYKVSLRGLIEANGLTPPYRLLKGQVLQMPVTAEHVVARGDTLSAIARRYGVDVSSLVRLNHLAPPYTIYPEQRLRLPSAVSAMTAEPPPPGDGPSQREGQRIVVVSPRLAADRTGRPPSTAPTTPRTGEERRVPPIIVPAPVSTPAPAPAQPPQAAATSKPGHGNPPPRHAAGFLWPVRGEVISQFGTVGKGQQNDGINIAVPRGAPVRASEGGVVVYAGSELRGFGNMLLIKHADGWLTAYAHNEALLVARGDVVERGQVVARAGSSGNVTEPQLHFEVRRRTRAVDPLQYLRDETAGFSPSAAPAAPPGPG